MSEFYAEMQGIASGLLSEFDQETLYYVKLTPGTGPRDDPGAATKTPYKIDAAARGVSGKYVDNALIVKSDLQLTMAVRPDVTPEMTGFVRMNGIDYKIVQVMNVPPAGVTVAHKIIFRK